MGKALSWQRQGWAGVKGTRRCLGSARVGWVQCGGLAQLGEHDVRNVGVGGSNPLPSTKQSLLDPEA